MRPLLYASALAASYAAVGGAYIYISTSLVVQSASTIAELSQAEFTKGIAYVLVTSTLLFGFAFVLLRRVARAEREVARAREVFVAVERRATLGLFAAAIGHDFNNILMVFQLGLSELKAGAPPASALATMSAAVEKADGLVRRLSSFSHSSQDELVVADARAEIVDAIALLRRHHKSKRCDLVFEAPEPVEVAFYPVLLHQIVMNLVMNAIDASPQNGKVIIGLKRHEGGMQLTVEDGGPGLPPVTDEELFAPFYTTKASGTGLGLPSVRYCVDAHGGTIETGRSELGGALFRIAIPKGAGA